MTRVTPRIPSGFLELPPEGQIVFDRWLRTIQRVYQLYGFTPIETPAIEWAEVLFAKGGGETEKQIYAVNNGLDGESGKMALHFDLTVPLARYVAEHEGQLTFPFRRSQTQKVWRGERPQHGRFREFYQCDIDVIGTTSPRTDAEIPSVIYAAFTALGFSNFTIRINNRKILNGVFAEFDLSDKSVQVLRIVDKLDKIGKVKVREELIAIGATDEAADRIVDFITLDGSSKKILDILEASNFNSELFRTGVSELRLVYDLIGTLGVPESNFAIDLTIARGLDYYTGTVYETILNDYPEVGSVCSGGRYDDLAGYYTKTELPGVGISIGLTRLFYRLHEAGVIEFGAATTSKVMVLAGKDEFIPQALEAATALRQADIPTEVFLEGGKMSRQIRYADKLGIPYIVIIGAREIEAGAYTVRDMTSGEQTPVLIDQLAKHLSV